MEKGCGQGFKKGLKMNNFNQSYEQNTAAAAVGHLMQFIGRVEDADPKVMLAILSRLKSVPGANVGRLGGILMDLVEEVRGKAD